MIFKLLQGIPLFQDVAASMSNTFPFGTSPLIPKTLNIIKYQLCGPLNDDKVNQKMMIKYKY